MEAAKRQHYYAKEQWNEWMEFDEELGGNIFLKHGYNDLIFDTFFGK